MLPTDIDPATNFEITEPGEITETVVVGRSAGSITLTLNEDQYRDLRTLIMRDTFENHPGEGLGPLGGVGGPFHSEPAEKLGDTRLAGNASEGTTKGPL